MQAGLPTEIHETDAGLAALLPLVRSGDPTNVEGRAARRYWTTCSVVTFAATAKPPTTTDF